MKNLLLSIFLVGGALMLQSCLHDDDERFGTPAAQRVQETVAAHKKLLESAPNGWEMHYYSGQHYTGGGYTMLIKFENGKAHVSSDLTSNTSMVSTGSYDVIKDMGPVLTFNTYNELMHFLAQPYQSDVEGEQGDFEFLILDATPEKITLKGKKWKNVMEMTRIPDGFNWKTHLDKIKAVNDKLLFVYDDKVGDKTVSSLYLAKESRRAKLVGENMPESAYYVTETGIHLYQPIDLGSGVAVSDLELDAATGELKAPGQPSLKISKSEDPNKNLDISTLFGTWDMACTVLDASTGSRSSKTLKVDLEAIQNELGTAYYTIMKGTIHNDADDYNFYLYYLPESGVLRLGSNNVADPTGKRSYLEVAGLTSEFDFANLNFTYDKDNDQLTSGIPNAAIAYLFLVTTETGEMAYDLAMAFSGINTLKNHVKK